MNECLGIVLHVGLRVHRFGIFHFEFAVWNVGCLLLVAFIAFHVIFHCFVLLSACVERTFLQMFLFSFIKETNLF